MAGTLVCCLRVISFTKEYLHTFKAGLRDQRRASTVLFIAIVLFLRIKSFPRNLCSRSSKNSSSVSKLETRSSKLDSRFSKTSRIKNRVSSQDCQLTFERYCICLNRGLLNQGCTYFNIFLFISDNDFIDFLNSVLFFLFFQFMCESVLLPTCNLFSCNANVNWLPGSTSPYGYSRQQVVFLHLIFLFIVIFSYECISFASHRIP